MMRRIIALALWLAAPAGLAAAPVDAPYKIIPGPMPFLPDQSAGASTAAPVPNYDLDAPHDRADGRARFEAAITDHSGRSRAEADGISPGSGFSSTLERKSRPLIGFGNALAPSMILRVPLK
jgi:hypothetical protein